MINLVLICKLYIDYNHIINLYVYEIIIKVYVNLFIVINVTIYLIYY